MNANKWLRLCGSIASATALLVISSALSVSGAFAQSSDAAASGGKLPNQPAPAPFLIASSFSLAGAPTGVATGDVNQDGKLDLVTVDTISGKVTVFLGTGQGKFAPGVEFASGSHPTSVAVADLNGDGRSEIVTGNGAERTISVLSLGADDKLQSRQTISVGFVPAVLAAGDFNGDGKQDFAVTAKDGSSLAILLNDGEGNLQKPMPYSLRNVPTSIVVADFNNDGRVDLALGNADGSVSVMLGTGDGSFHQTNHLSVAPSALSSITAGDFNRDGSVDLAVTAGAGNRISILMGKGDGSFTLASSYAVGNSPVSALVADFNGDGTPDLAVVNQGSNTFSVLTGNGDGSFKNAVDFVVGDSPAIAVAGNFDAEGHTDLAILNTASQTISVAVGNGDGTFKAARSYTGELEPRAVASADLNGDKLPDLAVTNYCGSDATCSKGGSVDIYLAGANGSYDLAHTYALGAGPVAVSLTDVDGDGHPDVLALNRLDKTLSVLLSRGDGSFEQATTLGLVNAPIAVTLADFNQDGKPDLAVLEDCGAKTCLSPGNVEILLGQSGGGFKSAAIYPVGYSPASIAAGDVNGDKSLDLIVANRCGSDVTCQSAGSATILLGSSSAKFTPVKAIALGNSPTSVALADLSGRGVLDLIASRSGDSTVGVLRGNGDGTFQAAKAYAVGNSPASVTVADFNGDGKPDVALVNTQDSTVSLLAGNGDGTLNQAIALPVGKGPESLVAVSTGSTHTPGIVTANGNTGSSILGNAITALLSFTPELGSATASISATSSPSAVSVDESATLTITVTGSAGTPTGTVTVDTTNPMTGTSSGAVSGCSNLTLDSSGTATCTTNAFSLSQKGQVANVFLLSYSGDSNYAANNGIGPSNQFDVGVSPLPATLSLAQSPAAPTENQSVTFTATITAAAVTPVGPAESITFTADGAAIAGCPGGVPSEATATTATVACTTSALTAGQHTIVAEYGPGDLDFTVTPQIAATSVIVAHKATLSLALSPTTPSPSVDTTATFVATITTDALTPTAPSGTLVFSADGVQIAGCSTAAPTAATPTTATASCSINSLTAGTHSITATYLNDQYYSLASPIATLSQAITAGTGSIGLVSSSAGNTSNVGTSVTFTATLTASAVSPIAPAGKISFTASGAPITGCTAVALTANASGGTATCQTNTLAAGSQAIVATYTGDSNFNVSVGNLTQTVNAEGTTFTLKSSAGTSAITVDSPVTFTATLVASSITPVAPDGNVTFTLNGTAICSAIPLTPNSTGGTASCTTSALTTPSGAIQATYNNDPNFKASPASFTQSVNAEAAPLAVHSSANLNTAPVNTPLVFTATLTPAAATPITPSGTVTFESDGVAISAACTNVPAAFNATTGQSTATCATSALPVNGTGHVILATYTDTNNNFSASPNSIVETVTKASPTLVVSSTAPSIAFQQSVTFTATLTGVSLTPVTPLSSGTVTFTYTGSAVTGTTTLCSAVPISSTGTASCPTTTLPAGADNITATYTGDTNYSAATSAAFPESVGLASPGSVTVSSVTGPSIVNQQVTFSATVTGSSAGGAPTGSVSFYQTGVAVPICSAQPLTGSSATAATATCKYTFTQSSGASSYSITATYSGNTTYGSTTSAVAATQKVSPDPVTVSVAGPSGGAINQPLTFTATLAPQDLGAALPTIGSVTFSAALGAGASTPLSGCTTTFSGAQTNLTYTCSTTFLTAGTYTIKAVYASSTDPNFTCIGSACSATQQSVIGGAATYITSTGPSNSTVVAGALNTSVSVSTTVSSCPISSPSSTCVVGNNANLNGTITYSDSLASAGSLSACTVAVTNQPSPFTAPACTVPLLSEGTHSVTANFAPSGNYNGSISSPVLVTVKAVPTTATIVPSTLTPTVDQPITFQINVTPASTAPTATVANPTAPSGSVSVSYYYGTGTVLAALCAPISVSVTSPSSPTTVSASCTAPLLKEGSYTLVASYSSANSNFVGSQVTSPIHVGQAQTAITVTPPAVGTVVNQPVSFAATVTPNGVSDAGLTIPTGTVTFTDTSTQLQVCKAAIQADGTLTCANYAFLNSGPRNILVAYSGDQNFASTSSTISFKVSQDTPSVSVTSSSSSGTSVATQTVVFTVAVKPTYVGTGPTNPAGITITAAGLGGPFTCTTPISSSNPSGVDTEACSITFPATTNGSFTVTAAYAGDTNFLASSSAPITQKVQNFSVAFTPSTGVTVTQGFSNNGTTNPKDPFNSVTITVNSTPLSGYSDPLSVACAVTNSSGTAVSDPSCTTSPATLAGNGGAAIPVTITASATAPLDQYSVVLTATDGFYSNLFQSTPAIALDVVSHTGTLSLAVGSSAVQSVNFNTVSAPTGSTLTSFACGMVSPALTSGSFTCTGPTGAVQTSHPLTTAAITITVNGTGTTASAPQRTGSIVSAAFWGVPLLALLVWLSNRKSPRRNFFRFLGMILLVAGLANVIGCGGSFTRSSTPSGGPTPGLYQVQVVATDSAGGTHTAVVPVTVVSNTNN